MEHVIIPMLGYKPLIGVVHLPPLPGSHYGFAGIERIIEYAVTEAKKLEEAHFDAVIIENYSDAPFNTDFVDDLVLTSISIVAREVVRSTNLKVGISLLRNAATKALAAAYSSGAHFIRVNAYCETRIAPEGILYPVAAQVESMRQRLDRHVAILADINVKHSGSLGNRKLEDTVHDCVSRGRMDAVIVSGQATSKPPSPGYVAAIKHLARPKPVVIGSGITIENIQAYWHVADGFIVGTSIKISNETKKPIDLVKAKKLAEKVAELRRLTLRQS